MAETAIKFTGQYEVFRRLKHLATKDAKRIGRQAINKGMTPIAQALRKETPKGPTGTLKRSVGKKNKKNRKTGIQEAKVGYNVGKKPFRVGRGKVSRTRAPHAHLFAMGTKNRSWKSGKSTGHMPGNHAVHRAYRASAPKAEKVIIETIKVGIKKLKAKR